ncbi:hypothetical protein GCM10007276_06260 [Agaricicola taiwanensis]|uniref:HTH luxR-type domain-containing protein n=1 Tax=Agaricicola taiwanensis TaxID=591372 RepID=A0A8J2VIM7_9RHOB|nr:response regulator transcription factor [Agaricicola taiwanensis]GGE31814.1 hypothetical protein GCM10007276_06260 [Agaricicola taiwanensis]
MLQWRFEEQEAQPLPLDRALASYPAGGLKATALASVEVAVISRGLLGHGICRLLAPLVRQIQAFDHLDALLIARDDNDRGLIVFIEPSAKTLAISELNMLAAHCSTWRAILMVPQAAHSEMGEAIAAGALGCITHDTPPHMIESIIKMVLAGHVVWPAEACPRPGPDASVTDRRPERAAASSIGIDEKIALLSKRERDVLKAVGRGLGNKRIAGELSISDTTVRLHMRSIMRKLGAENRTQVALSVARGLI